MMITSFKYDRESAVRSDGSNRINATGAYAVIVHQCTTYSSNSGAQFIGFVFGDIKTKANCQLSMNITSKDGKETFGMSIFNTLLKLTHTENAEAVDDDIHNIYDNKVTQGYRIKGVERKQVGVVLQKELYTNKDGKDSYRMNILHFFDPTTKKTASEIEQNKPAAYIDNFLKSLEDKDSRTSVNVDQAQRAIDDANAEAASANPFF